MTIDLDSILNNSEHRNVETALITEAAVQPSIDPVKLFDMDSILREWAYRCDKGYPEVGNASDMWHLQNIFEDLGIDNPFPRVKATIPKTRLVETEFTPADFARDKYLDGFITKVSNGQPFTLEAGKKTVTIDKSFLKVLDSIKALPFIDRQESIKKTFGKNAVIPLIDKSLIKLLDISKDTFTAKYTESGLMGTETPDFKEGLVVFFYSCPETLLNVVYNYLNGSDDSPPDFEDKISKINSSYYGTKSSMFVKNGLEVLASGTALDKKTKQLFLNALSAAYTIQKEFGLGYIIDRGTLFEKIRKAASKITSVPEDKWCPGDVYLYKSSDISTINNVIKTSEELKSIVNIEDASGKVMQIGLNSLFDIDNPMVIAVSLKEEEALSGRAKDFLTVKNISGKELGTANSDFSREEVFLLNGKSTIDSKIIDQYSTIYKTAKLAYEKFVQSFGYKNNLTSSRFNTPEINSLTRNRIVKSAVYKMLIRYFKNFDKVKSINDVMKHYNDPFLALTAYGVSLSGFNPTFYKVVADSKGDYGHITIFKGRDSLTADSDVVTTIDTPTKAGVYVEFITKMGEKKYKTKLDIREQKGKSSMSIAIIVDEFKEA